MARKDETPKAGLYNRLNPPPSADIARGRLDAIDTVIARIEFQLDNEHSSKWVTEEEYNQWHNAASKACGNYKAEKGFLNTWLAGQTEPRFAKNLFVATESTRLSRVDMLIAEIGQIAGTYEQRYEALQKNRPSETDVVAKELYQRLQNQLVEDIGKALLDANNKGQAIYAGRDVMPRIRKPLTDLQAKLQTLKGSHALNVHEFLLSLVQKALTQGLTLTVEEAIRLRDIKSRRR